MLHFVGRPSAFSDSFSLVAEFRPKNDLHLRLGDSGSTSFSVAVASAIVEDSSEDIDLKRLLDNAVRANSKIRYAGVEKK